MIGGILSPEERQYALYQGLLSAGPALMAAGAPSTTPGGNIQALQGVGHGLLGAQQGAVMQKMQGLQMEDYMRQREQEEAFRQSIEQYGGILSPEERQFLGSVPSDVGMGFLGERLFAGQGEGFTLGAGEIRYGPNGEVIAEGPAEPVTTATIETLPDGRTVEVKRDQNGNVLDYAFAPVGDTINNVIGGESDTNKFLFDRNTTDANDTYGQAQTFATMLPDLAAAEAALSAIPEGSPIQPGAFAETRLALARAGSMLGVQVDGLGEAELLQAINNRIAPLMRAPGSGSQSDMEFDAYRRAVPGMLNTREGNLQVIAHLRDMAAFSQKMSDIKTQAIINTQGSPSEYAAEVKRLTVDVFGTENPSIGPSFRALVSGAGDVPTAGDAGSVPESFVGAGFTAEDWALLPDELKQKWQGR